MNNFNNVDQKLSYRWEIRMTLCVSWNVVLFLYKQVVALAGRNRTVPPDRPRTLRRQTTTTDDA